MKTWKLFAITVLLMTIIGCLFSCKSETRTFTNKNVVVSTDDVEPKRVRAKRWVVTDKLTFVTNNIEVITVDPLIKAGDTVLQRRGAGTAMTFEYYIVQD